MTIENNWCTLKVDNSGIYALMCLTMPESDENYGITEQMVIDFLHEKGIVHGISEIAIGAMLENVMYGQYICVAKGKEAARGKDGYFQYEKEMRDMKKKPLIHDDGTADYKNSLSLATISEGELLATYIEPTDGVDGCDVFGNVIKNPGRGKDLLPLRGKGIVADEDKKKFYAEYSGHIVMDGNRISIDKLYIVNGNLDIETGNIKFDADVEICGDVRSGLEIDTKGSIFIHGHVGACRLNAGENIVIEKGVQGHDTALINAKGDIACKFVERCKIISEGNIYADSVLDSTLVAKKQIICTSKSGNVIGSELYGMTGIVVKEAGNEVGTPTLLRAGLPREEYVRAQELTKALQEIDDKLEAFDRHLETLEKANAEVKDISEIKMKIMRAKIVLNTQKKEKAEELKEINSRIMEDSKNSYINVTDTVYEGVRVYIGAFPHFVTQTVKEVSFKLRRSEVVCEPLE